MRGMKLVITDAEYVDFQEEKAVCAANGLEFVKYDLKTESEAAEVLREYPVVGNQYLRFTESLLRQLTNLKCIVRYGMGVDNIDVEAATRLGIKVCNVPDYCIHEVAAHAFAMMMALTRKLKVMDRSVDRGEWSYEQSFPIYRYSEMTVGVFGYGRIGRIFTQMAHALGCRIAAYDYLFPPTLSQADRKKYAIPDDIKLVTMEELFSTCHVISLHMPLSSENSGCVQKEQLAMMRPGAFLINVSRGGLVNERDLYDALATGRLGGAACDTWEKEPTDRDNPLLALDNFIATPHMAWYSEQASSDLKRKLAEECVRALKGEPLKYQLNRV